MMVKQYMHRVNKKAKVVVLCSNCYRQLVEELGKQYIDHDSDFIWHRIIQDKLDNPVCEKCKEING